MMPLIALLLAVAANAAAKSLASFALCSLIF